MQQPLVPYSLCWKSSRQAEGKAPDTHTNFEKRRCAFFLPFSCSDKGTSRMLMNLHKILFLSYAESWWCIVWCKTWMEIISCCSPTTTATDGDDDDQDYGGDDGGFL